MSLSSLSRAFCVIAAAISIAVSGPVSVMAQTAQSKPVAMSMTDTIAKVSVASDLVAYGRANKDAFALLQAAKMLSTVGANVQDPKSKPGANGELANFDTAQILSEAKTLASGNEGLNAEIEKTASTLPTKPQSAYWAYVCNCCGCWWVLVY